MIVKRWIVARLEDLCTLTHPVTDHRPWLWWFTNCPFTFLAWRLDDRWHTGHWTYEDAPEVADEQP